MLFINASILSIQLQHDLCSSSLPDQYPKESHRDQLSEIHCLARIPEATLLSHTCRQTYRKDS